MQENYVICVDITALTYDLDCKEENLYISNLTDRRRLTQNDKIETEQ